MQKIKQKSKTTLKSSYYCHVSRDTLNVDRVKWDCKRYFKCSRCKDARLTTAYLAHIRLIKYRIKYSFCFVLLKR